MDPSGKDPTSHPTPLFVHGNLLKHKGFLPSDSHPFRIIKRYSTDTADSRLLAAARMYVYTRNGMCIDAELIGGKEGDSAVGGLKIIDQDVEKVYGGLVQRFSELYFKYGGKCGGW